MSSKLKAQLLRLNLLTEASVMAVSRVDFANQEKLVSNGAS